MNNINYLRYFLCACSISLLLSCQAPSTMVKRENYQAKYEPEAGVYHGAGQDPDGFNDYVSAIGTQYTPSLYMTYINIASDTETIEKWGADLKKTLDSLPDGVMPQIGLAFTGGNDTGTGLDKAVAAGDYDEELEAFYKALLLLNRPSFTRIGYEFEGAWNGYSPESYRAVFIRIATDFKTKNIPSATVWCSGGGSANFMAISKLMEFYPGDEYVDWWGVDIFSPEEFTNKGLETFFAKANAHRKPVMIGESTPREVGVLDGEQSWDNWFAPYFKMVADQPGVKAICYINWDWAYWSDKLGFQWHHWGDARIEQNEVVLKRYQDAINNELFVHQKDLK